MGIECGTPLEGIECGTPLESDVWDMSEEEFEKYAERHYSEHKAEQYEMLLRKRIEELYMQCQRDSTDYHRKGRELRNIATQDVTISREILQSKEFNQFVSIAISNYKKWCKIEKEWSSYSYQQQLDIYHGDSRFYAIDKNDMSKGYSIPEPNYEIATAVIAWIYWRVRRHCSQGYEVVGKEYKRRVEKRPDIYAKKQYERIEDLLLGKWNWGQELY